jgi:hypothetical protein
LRSVNGAPWQELTVHDRGARYHAALETADDTVGVCVAAGPAAGDLEEQRHELAPLPVT